MTASIRRLRGGEPPLVRKLLEYDSPRNADVPPVEFLRELVLEFGDPAPALADLTVASAGGPLSQAALMMFALAAMEPGVPDSVRKRFGEAGIPVWRKALRSRELPEQAREFFLPLLALYGEEPFPEEVAALGPGPGSAGTRAALDIPSSDWEGMEGVLATLGILPEPGRAPNPLRPPDPEIGLECARRTLEGNPSSGAILSCVAAVAAVAAGVDDGSVAGALNDAAATGTGEAAWILGEIGRLPGMGPLSPRAAMLANGMGARGVVPRAPDPGRFLRAMATITDGAGSRSLLVLREAPGGEVRTLSLLLNEPLGVKDIWVVHEGGEGVAEAFLDAGLPAAPVDLAFARSLAGDALARHRLSGRPLPPAFLLFRPLLGQEPLVEKRHVPVTGQAAEAPEGAGAPSARGTGALADRVPYREFWFSSSAVYDFVRSRREREGLGPARRLRITRDLLAEFGRTVVPGERDDLLRRVDLALEIEALAGRGDRPPSGMARSVRTALASPAVPMDGIPFVAVLARRSLEQADANVRNGFRDQEEANRAGLEVEEELQERIFAAEKEIAWSPDPSALLRPDVLSRTPPSRPRRGRS